MTKKNYSKEREIVQQILRIDGNISMLQNIRIKKIKELAVAVKNDSKMDMDKKSATIELGWFWKDIEKWL